MYAIPMLDADINVFIVSYAEFMKRFTNHNDNWGDFIDIKKVSSIKIPEFMLRP